MDIGCGKRDQVYWVSTKKGPIMLTKRASMRGERGEDREIGGGNPF